MLQLRWNDPRGNDLSRCFSGWGESIRNVGVKWRIVAHEWQQKLTANSLCMWKTEACSAVMSRRLRQVALVITFYGKGLGRFSVKEEIGMSPQPKYCRGQMFVLWVFENKILSCVWNFEQFWLRTKKTIEVRSFLAPDPSEKLAVLLGCSLTATILVRRHTSRVAYSSKPSSFQCVTCSLVPRDSNWEFLLLCWGTCESTGVRKHSSF